MNASRKRTPGVVNQADLLGRVAEFYSDPDEALSAQDRMLKDVEYVSANVDEWRRQHPSKWIAVYDLRVVAAVDSLEQLALAVEQSGTPATELVVEFVHERPRFYQL